MTATGVVETGEKARPALDKEEAARGDKDDRDLISRCIGEYGKWQLMFTFLLSLVNFPCTFHIYAPTFEAGKNDFWCAPPQRFAHLGKDEWINMSHPTSFSVKEMKMVSDPCYIRDLDYETENVTEATTDKLRKCTSWLYDKTLYGETITSEWNLVCDNDQMTNIAETGFLVGVAFGGLASGLISDRFGRKKTLIGSLVAQTLLGTAVAFSPSYWAYVGFRSILGFFSVSVVFSGFVLSIELVGGKWMTIAGVCYLFTNSLAYITISGIAYLIKSWREFQLAITLPAVFFIALGWLFPESPRWLLTMRKSDQVLAVLEDAARFNKIDLPPNTDKLIKQAVATLPGEDESSKVGILDLFRTRKMRKVTLVLYGVWFTINFAYYGLVLNLSNMGGDIYLQSVISGAFEIPAIAMSILILLKLGKRWPLCSTTVLGGVACLLRAVIAPKEETWFASLAMNVARFCFCSSNVVLPLFTAEQYPTAMRNLGVGSSNAPAGAALLLIPYLWNMANINPSLPMMVLGLVSVIGGSSVLLLGESGDFSDP